MENLNSLIEQLIAKESGLSQEEARKQAEKLMASAENFAQNNIEALSDKMEALTEFDEEDVNAELCDFIKEMIANDYSEEQQIEITNQTFNEIGLGIEKVQNGQCQVKIMA